MVFQGNDVLSFYKIEVHSSKKWTFIVLQGINHRTHHAVNRPEGNWKWVKSNVTFALCSSLSTWELQDLFQSETVRHCYFARGMGSQDLWKLETQCTCNWCLWRSVWPGGWRTTTLSFLLSFSHVCPRLVLLKEPQYLHWHGRSPGCMSMIIAHANLLQHGPVTSCTKLCIGEPTNELEREIKRWIGEIMFKKSLARQADMNIHPCKATPHVHGTWSIII